MDETRSSRLRRASALLFLLSVACGFLACAGSLVRRPRATKVARQEWNSSRGPVVPHDRFPTDCSLCHVGTSWWEIREDFAFDHEGETGVPLLGAHATAECLRCHNDRGPAGRFAQRGCAGCHEDVHRGKLGKTCDKCHSEQDWMPERPIAEHNRTRFPLVGAHVATACYRCHPGAEVGNFDRTPTRCEDCHGDDVAQATNPDHLALGWIQDCQRCHRPTIWGDGTFNHRFPINSGPHSGPAACVACHPNPNNFNSFLCTGCHEEGETAGDHDEVSGYVWSSPACYACHPNGQG
jgi:hypothetical protein